MISVQIMVDSFKILKGKDSSTSQKKKKTKTKRKQSIASVESVKFSRNKIDENLC